MSEFEKTCNARMKEKIMIQMLDFVEIPGLQSFLGYVHGLIWGYIERDNSQSMGRHYYHQSYTANLSMSLKETSEGIEVKINAVYDDAICASMEKVIQRDSVPNLMRNFPEGRAFEWEDTVYATVTNNTADNIGIGIDEIIVEQVGATYQNNNYLRGRLPPQQTAIVTREIQPVSNILNLEPKAYIVFENLKTAIKSIRKYGGRKKNELSGNTEIYFSKDTALMRGSKLDGSLKSVGVGPVGSTRSKEEIYSSLDEDQIMGICLNYESINSRFLGSRSGLFQSIITRNILETDLSAAELRESNVTIGVTEYGNAFMEACGITMYLEVSTSIADIPEDIDFSKVQPKKVKKGKKKVTQAKPVDDEALPISLLVYPEPYRDSILEWIKAHQTECERTGKTCSNEIKKWFTSYMMERARAGKPVPPNQVEIYNKVK